MSTLQIRVPASSANLGPGFDTLGIAVNLVNRFELTCPAERTELEIISGIDPELHDACLNAIQKAANRFFEVTGIAPQSFLIKTDNNTPLARGLGSSGTMRLAVLFGLRKVLGITIDDEDLLALAGEMEGSTDNIAASFYGGMTASGIINNRCFHYHFDVPETIDFVAVSPDSHVRTDDARNVFPQDIPRKDAIYSVKHAVLLSLALATQDYDRIGDLFEDRLHQTYRQANIPALKPLFDVIKAARGAGAIGGYLSGSGSTIMAITKKNKESVAAAMQTAFQPYQMDSEVRFLKADNQGLEITEA